MTPGAQTSPYRLELLPIIPAHNRRARQGGIAQGDLVYYGPMPTYYGIGEVLRIVERFIVVDFRGTGIFGVHRDVLESHYLIPVPQSRLSLL